MKLFARASKKLKRRDRSKQKKDSLLYSEAKGNKPVHQNKKMNSFAAPSLKRTRESLDTTTPSAYATNFQELETKGYTVIENVVPAEVCAASFSGIIKFLNESGVKTDDEALSMNSYPNSHGIIQHFEAGHMQAVWDIRLHNKVTEIFDILYGDNDLLVSFDGFCWMPKHYRDNKRQWLHTDQSHKRLGLRCIQGYVNVLTSHDDCSGSLVVIPGSHLKHAEYAAKNPDSVKNPKDWHKFTDEEVAELGEPIRVHGGVGSLVLWDSRTAHSARPPQIGRENTRERCVVYVCYQPRAYIKESALKRKVGAFDNYRMTTHWPASRVEQFPEKPWTHGKPYTMKTPARTRVATPRMLELAGKTKMTTKMRRTTKPAMVFVKD